MSYKATQTRYRHTAVVSSPILPKPVCMRYSLAEPDRGQLTLSVWLCVPQEVL